MDRSDRSILEILDAVSFHTVMEDELIEERPARWHTDPPLQRRYSAGRSRDANGH